MIYSEFYRKSTIYFSLATAVGRVEGLLPLPAAGRRFLFSPPSPHNITAPPA